MDQNNLISVEQYLCTSAHNFNKDAKFAIIEINENNINLKLMTEIF